MKPNLETIKEIASIDILKEGRDEDLFIGRPFSLDFNSSNVLICDEDKQKVQGIAQGTFLLAFYDNEPEVEEAILLRALNPTKLPTDNAVVGSMIEYYKDNLPTTGNESKLDDFTRYEFSFSGMQCRVLGTFYRNDKKVDFGADLENFYSAHNYKVYKVKGRVLEYIVNQRDSDDIIPGNENEFSLGTVRYSSSLRFQQSEKNDANVYMNPADLLGKRTALFGMTRTGKSNTVKKVIEATAKISEKAQMKLDDQDSIEDNLQPFDDSGAPKFPVGQIIFDINGEYANPNLQDDGTAIYQMFSKVTRYSTIPKKDFKVMKVNFFEDILNGFDMIQSYFNAVGGSPGYLQNFLSVDLRKPDGYDGFNGVSKRYDRRIAAYKCCLFKAGFKPKEGEKLKFGGNPKIDSKVMEKRVVDPSKGVSYEDACSWFEWVWENYTTEQVFIEKKKNDGKEWADEDLQNILAVLTRFRTPGNRNQVYGYRALSRADILNLHTNRTDSSFEVDISKLLEKGEIVIVDLSQGNPVVQQTFAEKICNRVFHNSMSRFVNNKPNNFIQFYFEEAHNLFPKKEDKDLSQIYNRIAKEGAKLNLGMTYATQEVSSISSNILKNTQNWFIAHLNNEDETRELRKYYDFNDFTESLTRFSAKKDKGFVRMKTYSNPFVVPVQIDRFMVN